MKRLVTLLFFVSFSVVKAQVVDIAPSGLENRIPVEGGSIKAIIDKTTPLNRLIAKFEQPWSFVETGKGYWIGYTDNMFSIAMYKEAAIAPLLQFIKTSKNLKAKVGAVYTLHLIGINRTIVGRFTENFTNLSARSALLQLLQYEELGPTVMELLVRAPWQSDVPKLFSALSGTASYWYIVNGLMHYNLFREVPIHQKIPKTLASTKIYFPYSRIDVLEANFDFEKQMRTDLKSIKSHNNSRIHVDGKLFAGDVWGNVRTKIDGEWVDKGQWGITLENFLNSVTPGWRKQSLFSYGEIGNKIQYYVENNNIYICSPTTLKARLLNWWAAQPASYRLQFTQNHQDNKK